MQTAQDFLAIVVGILVFLTAGFFILSIRGVDWAAGAGGLTLVVTLGGGYLVSKLD